MIKILNLTQKFLCIVWGGFVILLLIQIYP